jgi:hypothetical protein
MVAASPGWLLIPTGSTEPEEHAAEARLRAFFIERDSEAVVRYVSQEEELELPWRKAAFIGSWNVDLTPSEVEELAERVVEEIRAASKRRRSNVGRARVVVSFKAVPWIEDVAE